MAVLSLAVLLVGFVLTSADKVSVRDVPVLRSCVRRIASQTSALLIDRSCFEDEEKLADTATGF